jgi:flagellar hook-length control protein FliK
VGFTVPGLAAARINSQAGAAQAHAAAHVHAHAADRDDAFADMLAAVAPDMQSGKASPDKTSADKTSPDKTSPESASPDSAASGKASPAGATSARTAAADKAAPDTAPSGQAASSKPASDKASPDDGAAPDQAAPDKAAPDKWAPDKWATEKWATAKPVTGKAASADKSPAPGDGLDSEATDIPQDPGVVVQTVADSDTGKTAPETEDVKDRDGSKHTASKDGRDDPAAAQPPAPQYQPMPVVAVAQQQPAAQPADRGDEGQAAPIQSVQGVTQAAAGDAMAPQAAPASPDQSLADKKDAGTSKKDSGKDSTTSPPTADLKTATAADLKLAPPAANTALAATPDDSAGAGVTQPGGTTPTAKDDARRTDDAGKIAPAGAQAQAAAPDAAPAQPAAQAPTGSAANAALIAAAPAPAHQPTAAPVAAPMPQHLDISHQNPAPNMAALGIAIAARSLSGSRQFDIRLDPPELGRVEVRLSIDDTGKASAHLSADRQQTLDLLQKDSSGLTRALRDAGLNVAQNGLNFSLRQQNGGNEGRGFSARGRGGVQSLAAAARLRSTPTSIPLSGTAAHGALDGRLDIRV